MSNADLLYHCPVYNADHLTPPCGKNLERIERIKVSTNPCARTIPWGLEKCVECRGERLEKKGMPFEDDIPRITEEVLHAITHLGAPTQHEIAAHLDRAVSTANQQVKLLMEVGKIIQLEGPRPYRYQLAGQSKPKQEEAVPMPIVSKTEPLATPCNNEVKPEKPPKTESPVTPVNGLPKEIKLPTVGKNRELFEAIYAEAEEQDRPLSNQIIRLLKIAMKEMGK